MKKYFSISLGLFALAIILLSAVPAEAQWRSKTHDKYEAVTGVKIKIDGNLSDWAGVPRLERDQIRNWKSWRWAREVV
ncbi:MAG: hypothetical protein VCF25_27590 [Candidatus Poribacteria bacterium]